MNVKLPNEVIQARILPFPIAISINDAIVKDLNKNSQK